MQQTKCKTGQRRGSPSLHPVPSFIRRPVFCFTKTPTAASRLCASALPSKSRHGGSPCASGGPGLRVWGLRSIFDQSSPAPRAETSSWQITSMYSTKLTWLEVAAVDGWEMHATFRTLFTQRLNLPPCPSMLARMQGRTRQTSSSTALHRYLLSPSSQPFPLLCLFTQLLRSTSPPVHPLVPILSAAHNTPPSSVCN